MSPCAFTSERTCSGGIAAEAPLPPPLPPPVVARADLAATAKRRLFACNQLRDASEDIRCSREQAEVRARRGVHARRWLLGSQQEHVRTDH